MKLDGSSHFETAQQKFLKASNTKVMDLDGYERSMADGLIMLVDGTNRALKQILDQLEEIKKKLK